MLTRPRRKFITNSVILMFNWVQVVEVEYWYMYFCFDLDIWMYNIHIKSLDLVHVFSGLIEKIHLVKSGFRSCLHIYCLENKALFLFYQNNLQPPWNFFLASECQMSEGKKNFRQVRGFRMEAFKIFWK